jgi:dipeptidyl aminopeptidase/acylaminoacyl peptidase
MAHAAARRSGVRSQLAVSDTASHWVALPQSALGWHRTIFEFLDEHY